MITDQKAVRISLLLLLGGVIAFAFAVAYHPIKPQQDPAAIYYQQLQVRLDSQQKQLTRLSQAQATEVQQSQKRDSLLWAAFINQVATDSAQLQKQRSVTNEKIRAIDHYSAGDIRRAFAEQH